MTKQCEDCVIGCSEEEFRFNNAESFASAAKVILGGLLHKRAYQHYCHLDNVLGIIAQRRWHLTKCSSSRLNDLQEPLKFAGKTDILKRTYIMCFGHCLSESAAMWGLYAKNDPFALRLTIPGEVMENWMRHIEVKMLPRRDAIHDGKKRKAVKEMDVKDTKGQPLRIQSSVFRDVLYASVAGEVKRDEYDRERGDRVSWGRAFYNLREEDSVVEGQYAGFIKDCEWRHEMESRLCIGIQKEIDDNSISIAVPQEIIASMRFTYSPWLKRSHEMYVKRIIETALKDAGVNLGKTKYQRFHRSVLQGALKFK